MKIDKITFKNEQAWMTIKSEDGEYLGSKLYYVNLLSL